MEMSVREARANFAAALAAAENGERVTITKNGKAVAEIGPPAAQPDKAWDWNDLDVIQAELAIATPAYPLDDAWRIEFDDPALSRSVLGVDKDRAERDA